MYVGAASAEALAAEFATPATAILLAPIIAAGTYDLLHICSTGDPGDPVLTEQDLVYALTPADFVNSGAAWARIQQWFVHMMWPVWCDCTSGTIPPPSSTAPLPTGSANPGLPSGPQTAPCWNVTNHFFVAASQPYAGIGELFLPWNVVKTQPPSSPEGVVDAALIPPGTTTVTTTTTIDSIPTSGAVVPSIQIYDANGAHVVNHIMAQFSQLAPQTQTATWQAPSGTFYWTVLNSSGATQSHTVTATVQFLCGGQAPGGVQTPCCPPDPLLDQKLNSVIQMLQVLGNQLVTGNAGLVDADVHGPLAGSGSITLRNACAAVRVEVLTPLDGWPSNPGTPNYYFSLGFITSIAVGAPLKGWRLVYAKQTFPLVAYADQIGFTLPPGVVVQVVEQLASP